MGKIKHGILLNTTKNGKRKLPKIYTTWSMMKQRCFNKNQNGYKRYGGRGITVSKEWLDFKTFYDDMNESMEEHLKKYGKKNTSLDRINNNGNYCKENCRWATRKEQCNNTRANVIITYKNKKYRLKKLSKKFNISKGTMGKRVRSGLVNEELWFGSKLRKSYGNDFLKDYLHFLNFSRQTVLIYRYGLKDNVCRTLEYIGVRLDITRERVRQLENDAFKILQKT